jgi:hypothetical protein
MDYPTREQVNNLIRHAGTTIGTIVTIGGVLAVLTGTQQTEVMTGVNEIVAGLTQAVGGAWKIGVVVGPMIIAAMTRWGWKAVSTPAVLEHVDSLKPEGSVKVLVAPDAPKPALEAADNTKLKNIVPIPPPAAPVAKTARPT